MINDKSTAKAGTLLSVTEGCYSDFTLTGFFVVLQDFVPSEQFAAYLGAHPEEKARHQFNPDKFLMRLIQSGLLLEVHSGELHMGSYGHVDDVRFRPVK